VLGCENFSKTQIVNMNELTIVFSHSLLSVPALTNTSEEGPSVMLHQPKRVWVWS